MTPASRTLVLIPVAFLVGLLAAPPQLAAQAESLSLMGIGLGQSERQVLDALGSPDNVQENENNIKVYEYGRLLLYGPQVYSGFGVYFKAGKVFRVTRLFPGDLTNPGYLPYLADQIPEDFGTMPHETRTDDDDPFRQVFLEWEIAGSYVVASAVALPVREYDPEKGYSYREPNFRELRIFCLTISSIRPARSN